MNTLHAPQVKELLEQTEHSDRFENKNDNVEFIVGLKLFSEVMMRNRTNPLFEDFAPHSNNL